MASIKDREQNLFRATDTMAQFYEEVESFLDILFGAMEREGYTAKGERLRSGTITVRNLSRRLLATATVLYVKALDKPDEIYDEDDEGDAALSASQKKAKDKAIPITRKLQIPFVSLWLFAPNTIPSVRTLSSPILHVGALGEMRFVDKRTDKLARPASPALSLSNLAQVPIRPTNKAGDTVPLNCWSPAAMKKFRMIAKLLSLEGLRLLEIDTQEKIQKVAGKLVGFCGH